MQAFLGRLGGAAGALVAGAPDQAAAADVSRRWDVADRVGLRVDLPGVPPDAVLWLDSLLPVVGCQLTIQYIS